MYRFHAVDVLPEADKCRTGRGFSRGQFTEGFSRLRYTTGAEGPSDAANNSDFGQELRIFLLTATWVLR